MNRSSALGVTCALIVLAASVMTSSKTPMVFLDPHGILVVIGGTVSAAIMCFPIRFFIRVAGVLKNKFLGSYSTKYETVINEITDLSKGIRQSPDYYKQKAPALKTAFLRDGIELIVQGGIPDHVIEDILIKRASTHSRRYEYDVNVFKTVAKFPPAFGLMGTTLGMISLLQNLGGKDAQKLLGPSMAIGLVATFYGIVLANLFLIPIAENLSQLNKEDETVRTIVIDGIRLLQKKEHPKVVEEHLKSYLLPHERAALNLNPNTAKAT
jgi:chemotaxis protein MotA